MGIAKFLKSGKISINEIDKKIEIVEEQLSIPYEELNDSDWGYIFEKYVGQIFESEGYFVEYCGLEKGFLDRGIDLIATKENEVNFIQCKFTNGVRIISKSRIEWILYKASSLLNENYEKQNKKIHFTLIVNSKENSFSKRKYKDCNLTFSNISKVEYPILQYFLDHNYIQNKVKLEFREIEINK